MIMDDTELPLFYNTCGKVFTNRIVFASVVRETEVNPCDIKNVQIIFTVSLQSIALIVVPTPLLIMPFFLHPSEKGLKLCIGVMGLLLIALAIAKTRKDYCLKLHLKDGRVITWHFWKNNLSDAQKFIENLKPLLKK